jgi:thymidine kinase
VQFTDAEMHQAILDVARNTLVVVATLDLTWAAVEFEAFSTISTQGEERLGSSFLIVKLTGFCQLCTSERATHSKRLEAPPDGGDIFVGDAQYLTVCARCHSA